MPGNLHNPPIGGGAGAPTTSEEFSFTPADWAAGTPNQIIVIRTPGAVGPGIIGPHNQGLGKIYNITVYKDVGAGVFEIVDVRVRVATTTGTVTMRKVPVAANFAGRIILEG